MYSVDTIAAIATAMSNSGIGIIRVSGSEAIDIVSKMFIMPNQMELNKVKSHTIHYGHIIYNHKVIDEVLVSVMKGPNSYTREDVVEINCHGGVVVLNKVLEICYIFGARPANPGEFTKRAFINGRIDLSQAEAVIDIINSKNEYALSNSVKQLGGKVSLKIKDIKDKILNEMAFIEAALDDPEHISLDNYSSELLNTTVDISNELKQILDNADNGRVIFEGIKTVILGKPNAGKSSFLNALVGEERAIVTDIEGTTRDSIEEEIKINGINLKLIDTAGIRDTEDFVEKIGVDKSKNLANDADLIIYIVDSSKNLDNNDYEIIDIIKDKKYIVLLNKSDLEVKVDASKLNMLNCDNIISISAKTNDGIEDFNRIINDMFLSGSLAFNDEVYITNQRQKNSIRNAYDSILLVKKSIEDEMPEDFFSIDLMNAYESLGQVTGDAIEDDLVNKIFSKFCMGK